MGVLVVEESLGEVRRLTVKSFIKFFVVDAEGCQDLGADAGRAPY